MKPFNDISSVVTELQNALACAGRIFDLLEEEPEVAEASETLKDVKGEVDIKNVCFHYDESKKLIEDFNLHVKPGMRVAIVGPTGCGKTTMINLLMRFYLSEAAMVWCFRKHGSKTELSATISRLENRKLQILKSSKQPSLPTAGNLSGGFLKDWTPCSTKTA